MQIKRWFLNNILRNYHYLLYDKSHAIVIDPLKSDIFAEFISKNKLQIESILITHKHGDHIAGVKKLLA
ncbi:MBL fold metallo-hydrolase, partial [Francisella tularensis subsp. holarctica]|uniref:MBL fold metallo-hydrolase n=1 Tax=Francisella tularensis TaxID=263 RepID=UPI002381BD05